MPTTTRSTKGTKGTTKGSTTKAAKVGTVGKAACTKLAAKAPAQPATVQQLAAAVALLPQGSQYGSAAAMFGAASPQGYPRTLGTQGRHCLRATGQGVGRGKRHGVTPAAWLAAYNSVHGNRQVHAS